MPLSSFAFEYCKDGLRDHLCFLNMYMVQTGVFGRIWLKSELAIFESLVIWKCILDLSTYHVCFLRIF